MGGSIFLRQGDQLAEMRETPYELEDVLQRLIAEHPNLLAGDQVDSVNPRRWLLVKREMGVRSTEQGANQWSLDHLFLDQDGVPTLIEVKRSSDTRIRREVVGQMLDYAANGVAYWPVEQIQSNWEAVRDNETAEREMAELLQDEQTPEQFWEKVKTNLRAGRVRMIFVADVIPPELLRVVQFLSEQMDPSEVLALEVKQFAGEGHTTIVPRVVGQRVKSSTVAPVLWDESSFFEKLQTARPELVPIARALHEWAGSATLITWGRGARVATFTPTLVWDGVRYPLFRVNATGTMEMQFGSLAAKPPFNDPSLLKNLRQRLNSIGGISLADDLKYPSLRLDTLKEKVVLGDFLDAWMWAVEQIKAQ